MSSRPVHRSGLDLRDGVGCDSRCQAAPGVVVAGDVANRVDPLLGRPVRIEHRMNATELGMTAARVLRRDRPGLQVPYFWTDQYDAKIQVYGTAGPLAELAVESGDPADGRSTAVFRADANSSRGWSQSPRGRGPPEVGSRRPDQLR